MREGMEHLRTKKKVVKDWQEMYGEKKGKEGGETEAMLSWYAKE